MFILILECRNEYFFFEMHLRNYFYNLLLSSIIIVDRGNYTSLVYKLIDYIMLFIEHFVVLLFITFFLFTFFSTYTTLHIEFYLGSVVLFRFFPFYIDINLFIYLYWTILYAARKVIIIHTHIIYLLNVILWIP